MDIYSGTLGQLVIVEVFVFFIWFRVLLDAVKSKGADIPHKRLLLTSLGLVLNAASITGIMTVRIYQLINLHNSFSWSIIIFYAVLATGNILFIVAACIGRSARLLKAFVLVTVLWTAFVLWSAYF